MTLRFCPLKGQPMGCSLAAFDPSWKRCEVSQLFEKVWMVKPLHSREVNSESLGLGRAVLLETFWKQWGGQMFLGVCSKAVGFSQCCLQLCLIQRCYSLFIHLFCYVYSVGLNDCHEVWNVCWAAILNLKRFGWWCSVVHFGLNRHFLVSSMEISASNMDNGSRGWCLRFSLRFAYGTWRWLTGASWDRLDRLLDHQLLEDFWSLTAQPANYHLHKPSNESTIITVNHHF